MDTLDIALSDLGRALGIEAVWADDEYRMVVGDRSFDLIADRKRNAIVLSALVGELPAANRDEVLGYLLDLNTGPALGGAALGVPAGSDAVILTDQIGAADVSGEWLRNRVSSFLSAMEAVERLLSEPAPESGKPAAETSPHANFIRI